MFSGSPRGAHASCAIYSVIETAKQNGFNPFAYLHDIISRIPAITNDEQWQTLLPQNRDAETLNSAYLATVREN